MSTREGLSRSKIVIAVVLPIAIILFPICYNLVGYVMARGDADPQPFLQMPEARFKQCVRETEYMRFHHWELLRQARNEVVREGKIADVEFDSCRSCHPNRDRFCNQCHYQANVRLDCFGCHYYPDTPETGVEEANSTIPGSSSVRRDAEIAGYLGR